VFDFFFTLNAKIYKGENIITMISIDFVQVGVKTKDRLVIPHVICKHLFKGLFS